jgi:dynamin-binding protein
MKKRNKRRLDYEKYLSMKAQGKKIDEKLTELVDQYVALNETLKLELPKLSSLTESLGNVCLVQFINIQTMWYGIWQDKVRTVLENNQVPKDIADIVNMFTRDFKYAEARAQELGIVNGNFLTVTPKGRTSQSTQSTEAKGRPSNLSSRSRGMSFNSDKSPSLPTPDFEKNRHSGQFTFSPVVSTTPGVSQFGYQTHSHSNGHSRNGSLTPVTPDPSSAFGSRSHTSNLPRPSTGRSATSDTGTTRPSNEYSIQYRRESGSTSTSGYRHVDGPPPTTRPFSGIFHSAMPLPDGPEDSQRSSRASSRDRNVSGGYNVLYLAASLFEFNISATKSEAGYPYLTYQAGEVC